MNIIVVSWGFDPIHSGHIEYLKSAKEYGDKLIVALNSDNWLEKKKGKPFMAFHERKSILEAIQYVDEVIDFKDDKTGSCIKALEKIIKNSDYQDERLAATMSLGFIGDSNSIPVLTELLNDNEPNIRWDAAIGLAKMGSAT